MRQRLSKAAIITLLYLAFAGFWILTSDWLVDLLITDRTLLVRIQAWKGSAFVLMTAVILYALLRLKLPSPHETNSGATGFRASLLIAVYILMLILIGGIGYLVYRQQALEFTARQFSVQSTIVKLKARHIENWLTERRQDIKLIQSDPILSAIDAPVSGQLDKTLEAKLQSYFNALLETKEWVGVTLYTKQGHPLFTTGEAIEATAAVRQAIIDSSRSRQLAINDIHRLRSEPDQYRLEFIAPIIINEPQKIFVMVVLSADPTIELYKSLNEWSAISADSELFLVRREGDEVAYLNRTEWISNYPLTHRKPLSRVNLSATRAVLDGAGFCRCINDRDMEVWAAFQPISGMPWHVLLESNADAMLKPLKLRAKLIFLVVIFAVGAGGLAVLLLWRSQQMRFALFRQRQLEDRAAIVGHYDRLVKLARDIFLLTDLEGRIVEANEAASSAYGYEIDELCSMTIRDLTPSHLQSAIQNIWPSADTKGGALFEILQLRKNGDIFPVEISCSPLEIDGNLYWQSFIRDISARQAAEEQIQRLNKAYATLSETNQAIVRTRDPDKLFQRLCRIAVEYGGYLGAWIGRIDDISGRIEPAASYGALDEYLRQTEIEIAPDSPKGRGPTANVMRKGRPYYCEDFLNDPATAPWHDLARQYGIGASVALPLRCSNRLVAVFNLYAAETHIFDRQMRTLLEEMAQDISFALDNFERETARKQAEHRLKTLFETIPDFVWLKDHSGTFLACNPAIVKLFGVPVSEIIGKTDYDFVDSETADAFRANDLAAAAAGKPVTNEETLTFSGDGRSIRVQTTKTPMYDAKGKLIGVLGIARDISELKQQQALLAAANNTLEQIAEGRPLTTILKHIARNIEQLSPDMLCSILLMDADDLHLRHGSAPSLPDGYNRSVDGIEIGPSVGSCGTAAFTKQPVFVDDIAESPLWKNFNRLALDHGLRACWSTPIFSGTGKVLGTFAAYYRTPRHATESERQLINTFAHLAAITIEREQDTQKLNRQLDELRRWHTVTLDRESRIIDLKQEVNALLTRLGEPTRYSVSVQELKP
ncbi:GAF domain-containing protein [Methylotuvimicrobium buryatense]|uniref:GAF domain-containing protein n=1 Tax=Methylotuvimicrobium buryatense TaxID=95641 RepID=UPI00034C7B51|nr:GAF domain-containing protein [Methylotuvimicrobium buryatense]